MLALILRTSAFHFIGSWYIPVPFSAGRDGRRSLGRGTAHKRPHDRPTERPLFDAGGCATVRRAAAVGVAVGTTAKGPSSRANLPRCDQMFTNVGQNVLDKIVNLLLSDAKGRNS